MARNVIDLVHNLVFYVFFFRIAWCSVANRDETGFDGCRIRCRKWAQPRPTGHFLFREISTYHWTTVKLQREPVESHRHQESLRGQLLKNICRKAILKNKIIMKPSEISATAILVAWCRRTWRSTIACEGFASQKKRPTAGEAIFVVAHQAGIIPHYVNVKEERRYHWTSYLCLWISVFPQTTTTPHDPTTAKLTKKHQIRCTRGPME
jgi:hypothetical protein